MSRINDVLGGITLTLMVSCCGMMLVDNYQDEQNKKYSDAVVNYTNVFKERSLYEIQVNLMKTPENFIPNSYDISVFSVKPDGLYNSNVSPFRRITGSDGKPIVCRMQIPAHLINADFFRSDDVRVGNQMVIKSSSVFLYDWSKKEYKMGLKCDEYTLDKVGEGNGIYRAIVPVDDYQDFLTQVENKHQEIRKFALAFDIEAKRQKEERVYELVEVRDEK